MSEAFQRFLKTRVYENTATAEEILADLHSIRSLDKQKESETMKFGCGGALLIPLALVGMLFGESQPLLAISNSLPLGFPSS